MAASHDAPSKPRRRTLWLRAISLTLLALIALLFIGIAVIGEQYHGPRTLDSVTRAMPGVPLFPYAQVAPRNRNTQRFLALPLLFIRLQGVKTAEAVVLQTPAERDFVLLWYRAAAPPQDWVLRREEALGQGKRLVFSRGQEVLQVIVGPTQNHLTTPVQLIYLNGVSARQLHTISNPPAR